MIGEGVEFQADGMAAFGSEDAETVFEVFFDGKIGRGLKGRGAQLGVFHPGQDEGAEGFSFEAEADDIPPHPGHSMPS